MIIRIKNLKLKTIIGVYDWEKSIKRDVVFNIEVETKNNKAITSDKLQDTIDYDNLIAIVKEIAAKKFSLIEKMAGEIVKKIMANKKISRCKIELDKMGIVKEADSCSVVIEKKR